MDQAGPKVASVLSAHVSRGEDEGGEGPNADARGCRKERPLRLRDTNPSRIEQQAQTRRQGRGEGGRGRHSVPSICIPTQPSPVAWSSSWWGESNP
eukprot:2842446-Rhodomonas_salina.4